MKYQFLTVNTGHLSRHDTDVDLRPEVVPMVRALVEAGAGTVPGMKTPGITYAMHPETATTGGLSVYAAMPHGGRAEVLCVGFFLAEGGAKPEALAALAVAARAWGEAPSVSLRAPGLAVALLGGSALVAPGDLFILADFEKTMFSVWALGKLDAAHKS